MTYYNEDQLYRYFEKAIQAQADKKIDQLRKEIDYVYAKEMKKIKDDLVMKKELELNKELRDLRITYQDQINKIGVGFDEKLIKERTFMINIIFQSVLLELGDFIQTKAYDEMMAKRLSEINKYVSNKKVIYQNSKNDNRISDIIEKTVTSAYEIKTSHEIKIGGFIAEITADKVEIDETLDKRLKERKAWFFKNSKLFIRT